IGHCWLSPSQNRTCGFPASGSSEQVTRIEREPIVWAHYFWLGQNKRLVQQDGQSGFIALLTAFA
ncbi:hypothetical protein, partial [Thiolapillus sp.]|uniref:hypothetical protein n=1 Tax=Thiolapillus sp. TaxID=2017437 RepID=UPI003AF48E6A